MSRHGCRRVRLIEEEKNQISTTIAFHSRFSKWPGTTSDPFHTYFGLCGLSFLQESGLLEVMPSLNISMRAHDKLKNLHTTWNQIEEVQLNIE